MYRAFLFGVCVSPSVMFRVKNHTQPAGLYIYKYLKACA